MTDAREQAMERIEAALDALPPGTQFLTLAGWLTKGQGPTIRTDDLRALLASPQEQEASAHYVQTVPGSKRRFLCLLHGGGLADIRVHPTTVGICSEPGCLGDAAYSRLDFSTGTNLPPTPINDAGGPFKQGSVGTKEPSEEPVAWLIDETDLSTGPWAKP